MTRTDQKLGGSSTVEPAEVVGSGDPPRRCPCGGCVTCACAAIPKMDEDGLCASCGGQPLLLAALAHATRPSEPEPHLGSEVEGERSRARILGFVEKGIPAETLAPWLAEAAAEGEPCFGDARAAAPLPQCVAAPCQVHTLIPGRGGGCGTFTDDELRKMLARVERGAATLEAVGQVLRSGSPERLMLVLIPEVMQTRTLALSTQDRPDATDLLLDLSAGEGIPADFGDAAQRIRHSPWSRGLGLAGGLCAENLPPAWLLQEANVANLGPGPTTVGRLDEIETPAAMREGTSDFIVMAALSFGLRELAKLAGATPVYRVETDSFTEALAAIVRQFKAENNGIGMFRATCHDGTVVTIEIEKKKPRQKKGGRS